MTKEVEVKMTLSELEESTPEGQREMAAARGMLRAVSLMNAVVEQNNISHKALAESLGVTEGRVSQVLGGDGNIRLSTLARYLRAAGYALSIDALPADRLVKPIRKRTPKRRRVSGDVSEIFVQHVEHGGVPGAKIIALSPGMPLSARETNEPVHVGQAANNSLRVLKDGFTRELKG